MRLKYILFAAFAVLFASGCSCNCGTEIKALQVYFEFGDSDILNTFDNQLTVKDNEGHVQKAEVMLSEDEKHDIAELAAEFKFFSLPDTIQSVNSVDNVYNRELRIKVGILDKTVIWSEPAGNTEEEMSITKMSAGMVKVLSSNDTFSKMSSEE